MKALTRGNLLAFALPVAFGGIFLGLWYLLRYSLQLHHYELPTPGEIVQAGWQQRFPLARAALTTFLGSASGFLFAAFIGFFLSIFLAASSCLRRGLYPYIICMQMVPIIATSAIIVLWLDVGLTSVATIAFFISFFPIVANTLHGLRSVPLEQVELFHIYKASRLQEFLLLRIPFALPSFFTGMKIAATLSVIGSVTGEIFAGSSEGSGGLGFMIIVYKAKYWIPEMFAATFLCCLLGFIFVGFVLTLKWLFLHRWYDKTIHKDV